MRIDKFLCDRNLGSRSEIKAYIKKGAVSVNGLTVKSPDFQVSESDRVTFQGKDLSGDTFVYYLLNKPAGYITATEDPKQPTVMDLLKESLSEIRKDVSPVGRLDKDTEGLLILTNDGAYNHRLMSPKQHVQKTYEVTVDGLLTPERLSILQPGLDIGEGDVCGASKYRILSDHVCHLSIREGKYHQVKRMMAAAGYEVLQLKRISIGGLTLPSDLGSGEVTDMSPLQRCRASETAPDPLRYKAVIFDVDGSLVDSMGMWNAIDIEYLGRFGIPLPPTLQNEIEGMSFLQTAEYFQKRFPEITDSIDTIMDDWNQMAAEHYRYKVECKEGVMEFLKYCKENGILMGVATSNSRYLWSRLDEHHGFSDYMNTVVTGSEVTNGKPAPDIYLKAAEHLRVKPEECLVFEDILPGISAAKAAGMKVCAVDDAYSADQEQEKREQSDHYIHDYRDLWIPPFEGAIKR